jgi:hypothetical protein
VGSRFNENFAIRTAHATLKGRALWSGDAGAGCDSFGPNKAKWHTKNQDPNERGVLAIPSIVNGYLREAFK